jgi:hypothetical protein
MCKTGLTSVHVPRLCVSNGLHFSEIPDYLPQLAPLEERLVSPRIPFINIRPLGLDKQFGIRGSAVNFQFLWTRWCHYFQEHMIKHTPYR